MRHLSCRRLLAFVLAAAMILSLVPHTVYAEENENLALGKTVTVSSYEAGTNFDGSKIVDGSRDAQSRWGNNTNWKIAEFEGVQAKYVRLVAVNAVSDNSYVCASAAEIRLTGEKKPVPVIQGFSLNPTTMSAEGGKVTVTVIGENLSDGIEVTANGSIYLTSGTAEEQTAQFELPANETCQDIRYGVTVEGFPDTVTVNVRGGHDIACTVTEPTCTEQGYTTYSCTRCDYGTVSDYVPALGHMDEILPAVAPSCTETGLTEGRQCSVCGEILVEQKIVDALGHDWKGTGCTRCDATRENPFTDVPEDSFFIDPVLWAVEAGITNGTSATTFSPYGVTNRAQAITFLWRYLGQSESAAANSFSDVVAGAWYEKAINWAVEQGITNGMSETQFGITVNCNRAHMVTFLYRALAS